MNTITKIIYIIILSFISHSIFAQTVQITGKTLNADQLSLIKNVSITAYKKGSSLVKATTISQEDGTFTMTLPSTDEYRFVAEKRSYLSSDIDINIQEENQPLEILMKQKPGYIFDVSLINADFKRGKAQLDAIQGARIEVYNNTTHKEELALMDHPQPSFVFSFEEGNHYTIMVRKKGYLTKRIEAYINIEGCILCFDGLGIVEPNVVDVMAQDNQLGAFLANLELEPVAINTTFKIENLYYDYDQYNIRTDAALVLDNVVQVLKDNPALKIEMGSHTDARGSDHYNMILSDKRAKSAVEYLVDNGIDPNNLTWRGYGETRLINSCTNNTSCEEEMHQENRRTELKITGIEYEDPLDKKSLREIIARENYSTSFSYR